jgi:nitronate monooxygenase
VIRTPYIDRVGTDLNWIEKILLKNSWTKKPMKLLRTLIGARALEKAAGATTWKEVWSAGQSSGLVNEVLPAEAIVNRLMRECHDALNRAKNLG